MAGFKATPEQLDALGKHIDTEQAQIATQITRFNGIVDDLQAGWKGDAFAAYDALQQRVNQLLTNINKQLDDIGELMTKGSIAYAQNEAEVKQQMSSITAALG
ncbi:WXG100 family type VII secretion target [Uniformispora flossi]|uniref:ESAT-6-like protein n=1 Tax=Yinghuangia aomiensis TaxID=676205 RepID=A0ABP9I322_9ACTN